MRFEVNTDVPKISEINLWILISLITIVLIFLTNFSLNLMKITRLFEVEYLCKVILVDKNTSNYKRLRKLTSLKTKQKIWDLCKEINNR